MRSLQFFLLSAVIMLAPVQKWDMGFSFRLHFFEMAALCFIALHVVAGFNSNTDSRGDTPPQIRTFAVYSLVYLAAVLIGSFRGPSIQENWWWSSKAFVQLMAYTVFFIFAMMFQTQLKARQLRRLIFIQVAAVFASVGYLFIQIGGMEFLGFNIDATLSRVFASGGIRPVDIEQYGYGQTYRYNGLLPDPNMHSAYLITVIPLLLLLYVRRQNFLWLVLALLALVSSILTMSVSGTVSLLVAIVVALLGEKISLRPMFLCSLLLGFFGMLMLAQYFWQDILYYSAYRFNAEGSSYEHYVIARKSLSLFADYPMGIGLNNFSPVYDRLHNTYNMGPHNSWLRVLVEQGLPTFILKVTFTGFILLATRRRTLLQKAFFASLVGLIVAGNGYESFDSFAHQLFISLTFAQVIIEQRTGDLFPPRGAGGALRDAPRRFGVAPRRVHTLS